jgi:hypothetical protein
LAQSAIAKTFAELRGSRECDYVTIFYIREANMKKLKILPGAAGIIALTATIGFVDGQRDAESEYLPREQFSQISVMSHHADSGDLSGNAPTEPDGSAYLVKIKRGELSQDVLVDASTGNVLKS